jgi:hypothetical protein
MSIVASRKYLEEYAKQMPWKEILGPVDFREVQVDVLNSDLTPVLNWTFDKGGLILTIQTYGEEEDALILDWNHQGSQRLSKLDAIKKFRCGENWVNTKAFILEGISQGGNTIDKVSRLHWSEYQQSSIEMAPDVRYVSDPLFQAIVDSEFGSMIARDMARSKFEEMQFAQEGEPTPAIALRDLLQKKIDTNKWVVQDLLIKAGKVFLAAKAKAGKTTMCVALLKSLADGGKFLNRFHVEPPEGNIGYMNLELTEAQMQEWVSRQDIKNLDRIHFWNLRGKPNPFRSTASRNSLINEIQSLGIKTLIIDTFSKIFPGEANNNSEVNKFLLMLDETLEKAGVEQLIMLVHAGNDAKKIRGATALTDHPDAIWYLYNDEERNRFFSAVGRDVDVEEGQISFDPSMNELEFTGAGKKATKDASSREKMLRFIAANAGQNASTVDDSVVGTKSHKIKLRKQLIRDGLVIVRKGPNNSDLYFAV